MILHLPIRFDGNEWLVLIVLLLELILFFILPRRFPTAVTILLLLFNAYLGRTADNLIEYFPFDLYDSMDTSNYDLFDFFIYTFVYPFYGYLFFYFYDKLRLKGIFQSVHIFIWMMASTGFEALALGMHLFHYKGWQLMYSATAYLFLFCLNSIFFRFIQYQYDLFLKEKS